MSKSRNNQNKANLPPPNLTVQRDKAKSQINERIAKGKELNNYKVNNTDSYDELLRLKSKWISYNTELLLRIFDNPKFSEEFSAPLHFVFSVGREKSIHEKTEEVKDDISRLITRLENINERLELIPDSNTTTLDDDTTLSTTSSKQIFIVHGHDESSKEILARFLTQLNLEPIILHELPNQGKTIIEKFEGYSNVNFAIALLTPDDTISDEKGNIIEKRARQNVIMELGYFFGKLGRSRTCALYKEGVTLPSDISGILYIELDSKYGWKLLLARELKQIGYNIDMNSLV